MMRVVAECLANKHLGVYEEHVFSSNGKCQRCGQYGLRRMKDDEGHGTMPLKQAQRFIRREEERRETAAKAAKAS